MNQARIWLVVKPTVGLPLFLGSVTIIALLVHLSILSHTSWYPSYWNGAAKASIAAAAPGSGREVDSNTLIDVR